MVTNPGAPSRPDQLRPLNTPRPIEVVTENDLPVALLGPDGARLPIVDIQETWRIDDEWWREPIHRRYYRLILKNGSLRTVYVDLIRNSWHEQRY